MNVSRRLKLVSNDSKYHNMDFLNKVDISKNYENSFELNDTVTGLPNKTAFELEYLNLKENGNIFGIIMLQLSFDANETEEKIILKEFIKRVRKLIRDNDFVARYDKSKISIIVNSEKDIDINIVKIGERIIAGTTDDYKLPTGEKSKITISINCYAYKDASNGLSNIIAEEKRQETSDNIEDNMAPKMDNLIINEEKISEAMPIKAEQNDGKGVQTLFVNDNDCIQSFANNINEGMEPAEEPNIIQECNFSDNISQGKQEVINCIVATEILDNESDKNPADVIIRNVKKIDDFKEWNFVSCHDAAELLSLNKKIDIIILSRYLVKDNMESLLKSLPLKYPYSRIILLVGNINEKAKAFIRMAESYGLTNIVTGKLPGDRPYTLPVALKTDKHEKPWSKDKEDNEKSFNYSISESDILNNSPKNQALIPEYRGGEEDNKDRQVIHKNLPVKQPENRKHIRTTFKKEGLIVVTCANKGGVGKSTTAATLGIALANAGIPNIIVDLDLGSPNIADFFKIDPPNGIEALSGLSTEQMDQAIENILYSTKYKGLTVLPGPIDKSILPDKMFSIGKLKEIIFRLTNEKEIVIIDTPAEFWTNEWLNEVFEECDLLLAIADQSKFSVEDTSDYSSKIIEMGVSPEKIKIVLNKYSPKLINPKVIEKSFSAGLGLPPKMLPEIVAVIPEDWDSHAVNTYKGEAVGLNDSQSQWHNIAKEVAEMSGKSYETTNYEKKQKQSKGIIGRIFRRN